MLEIITLDTFWSKLIFALVGFVPILYWYLTRNYSFWSKQGLNGPKPLLFFGNFLEIILKSPADLDYDRVKKYGKVYGTYLGTSPVLQVADNDLVKEILVKEFNKFSDRRDLKTYHEIVNQNLFNSRGDQWKRIRTITSSTFTSGKMKKLYGLVRKCLQGYLEHLEVVAETKDFLNVKQMHENLTMDVIASCAFATQTNAVKEPDNEFIQNCRQVFQFKAFRALPAMLLPRWANRVLGITTLADPVSNEWILSMTKAVVERRRITKEKNNDFLQLLVDAKAEDKTTEEANQGLDSHYILQDDSEKKMWNSTKLDNKTLTDNEILAQAWIFLLAGFETTATTLGYMSYLLATNPQIQDRLYNEVSNAMDSNGEIDYETLHSLPYLDACISETLRLFPPLIRLERECNTDLKLGDSEIHVQKGQTVEVLVYAMHHNPDYFPDPEQYKPDRFLPENKHHIIPYTYMPFGNGPRNCIGMRFALMEIKLAMTHILKSFRFTTNDKTEKNIEFNPLTILLAAKSVTVGIEKRK